MPGIPPPTSARPSTSVAAALAARNAAAAKAQKHSTSVNSRRVSNTPEKPTAHTTNNTGGSMGRTSIGGQSKSGSSGGGGDNLQVCVRIRPPNDREERHSGTAAWSWKDNTIAQVATGQRNRGAAGVFTFDHLFDPISDTEEIYEQAVRRVILATMGGYHGSVFAYGQTSTGKTHTMQGTEDQPGVIPLAIEECFSYVAASEDDREFLFRVSYLEIYNEQINDLLCPASTQANVRIMESKKLGVQLQGVKEEVVISPQQVYALISAGEAQRHVGSTDANKNSSRSHTIFRMVIESRSRSSKSRSVMSTLSLVDLAGSESVRLANTHGQRQIEGGFINKSLLTLGKVVSMLTEDENKQGYIPYRDSKLTRLLQPSLGGNAQITIICTVTAALLSVEETHNTLKFANRAKRIKNHAAINEVSNEKTLLKKYLEEIAELKAQLAHAKATAEEASTLPPPMPRLSPESMNKANMGSPSVGHGGFGAGGSSSEHGSQSDIWVEEDDTEMTLQNTIHRLERLILKSKAVKAETPGSSNSVVSGGKDARAAAAAAVAAAAVAAASRGGGNGGTSDSSPPPRRAHGLSIGGRTPSSRSRLRAPLTDRPSMPSRRQSTSFFDTKPLHSARDSAGSFTNAWNAMGDGVGPSGGGGGGGGNTSAGLGSVGEHKDVGLKRKPALTKAAGLRAQSERWGTGAVASADAAASVAAAEEAGIGTPPTVEGSAESSSGSPSDRRPPPLVLNPDGGLVRPNSTTALLDKAGETSGKDGADGRSRGGSEGGGGQPPGVDLEFELEHVHTELQNFLQKKRAQKLGGGGGGWAGGAGGDGVGAAGGTHEDVERLRQKLHKVEIDTALSQADSNFLQRALEDKEMELQEKQADIAECMDLLEEMELRERALSEENTILRRHHESNTAEIIRLSAILAAREQELYGLKGVSAVEETF